MPLSLAHIDTLLSFISEDRGDPKIPLVPLCPAGRDEGGRSFLSEAWRMGVSRGIPPVMKRAAREAIHQPGLLPENFRAKVARTRTINRPRKLKGWKTFIRNVSQPYRTYSVLSRPLFRRYPPPRTMSDSPAGRSNVGTRPTISRESSCAPDRRCAPMR